MPSARVTAELVTADNQRSMLSSERKACRRVLRCFGSPSGIRTRERRAPIRCPLVWTLITDFNSRTTPSVLDASLGLAAHKDNKFGAPAGLET